MENKVINKPEAEKQKVVIELDYCRKVCDGCYSGTKFFTGLNHEDEASKWVDEMYKLPQVLTCKQQAVENKDITIVDILFLHTEN